MVTDHTLWLIIPKLGTITALATDIESPGHLEIQYTCISSTRLEVEGNPNFIKSNRFCLVALKWEHKAGPYRMNKIEEMHEMRGISTQMSLMVRHISRGSASFDTSMSTSNHAGKGESLREVGSKSRHRQASF